MTHVAISMVFVVCVCVCVCRKDMSWSLRLVNCFKERKGGEMEAGLAG